MGYYPVMVDLGQRSVVVVGTGSEALAKIEGLLAAGARIEVFDTVLEGPVAGVISERVVYTPRLPRKEEIRDRALVIAAHRDMDVNRQVAHMAQQAGALWNIVDQPALSTCIMVSQLRRGDLVIGVSTSGKAPGLSRRIRHFRAHTIIGTPGHTNQNGFFSESKARPLRLKLSHHFRKHPLRFGQRQPAGWQGHTRHGNAPHRCKRFGQRQPVVPPNLLRFSFLLFVDAQ